MKKRFLVLIGLASLGAVPAAQAAGNIDCELRFNLSGWSIFYKTATGNGTVMIYKDGSSSNQDFSGSWSKTYTGDEAKDLSMFSVHGDIMGGNDQQVTCKVIVNGQEKVSKDASGSAGSVMCNIPWF